MSSSSSSNSSSQQQQQQSTLQIKQLITNISHKERLEILEYLSTLDRCDIIGNLPIVVSALVFEYFTPSELCQLRLGEFI